MTLDLRTQVRPDSTVSSNKTSSVDHFEQLIVPALLQLNRGPGYEHKAPHDTCPPKCSTSPASFPDCLECRNGGSENGFNLHCEHCLVDCASPCNDDDCDIPQACYDEHCATECVDEDCEADPCPIATCRAESVICTTTCFDESCLFPTADGRFSGFDPQLCEQGECYGFLPCESSVQQDFSLSHDISNHYPPSIFSHNTPLWNHSIPPFHAHAHDHHTNTNSNHKRRRVDGGSSRSSLQSDNCYQPQFDWQAWQSNYGSGYGSSAFNFQQQQDDEQSDILENNGWQGNHFGQIFPPSGDFTADLRASQTANELLYATLPASSTSNSYLTAPTNLSNAGNQAGLLPHTTYASNLAQSTIPGYAETLEGLTCQLSHVSGFEGSISIPDTDHSPYCSASTARPKLARPRSPAAKVSPLVNSESAISVADDKRGSRQSIEATTTCQWVISEPDDSLEPKMCSKTFSCSKELDDHVQKEHTNKLASQQFVCGWLGCNTSFKHRGKLNRHVSGAHSRYHAHHCTHCERTFCTKEQLKNHETTHTGEKKYKCSFCDHTSATKTQHNTHERTHTKEKPYACPYCLHRSGDSSNLSKHIKNKHPGPRNLPNGHVGRSRVKVEKAG
jgi:hypothetical protein